MRPRGFGDDIETETGGQNDGNTGQNGKEHDRMSFRNSNTKESNVKIETQMQKKRHIDTEFMFVSLSFILRYVHIRFSSFLFSPGGALRRIEKYRDNGEEWTTK
jgi:hypothetical protein